MMYVEDHISTFLGKSEDQPGRHYGCVAERFRVMRRVITAPTRVDADHDLVHLIHLEKFCRKIGGHADCL